ncbi:accessory Sec system S-layer assembly protein [Falsibacillus pallidus]|uniref:Accessory Sec system S-layer assembly protein n=1 Tax=Falsibacillus pallidus TaxID=493781 RepID=A0A370GCG2_9BACI|nr:accessory Sec system S-layer assembly protein [Falsibacillus pallidus]RDI40144.1 accessory Sec system S-layer assembly protein [Falsibacillus pallidus]
MFPFFKKKVSEVKKTGLDDTVSSSDLVNEQDQRQEEEVETALSFHPAWNLEKEQEYVFRFLNNELSPLKPNQISLAGVEMSNDGQQVAVTAFVRNSLQKPIKMENVELLLMKEDGSIFGRKEFDFAEIGEIPAESSRPWVFTFEKDFLLTEEIPSDNWKLAFNVSSLQPHRLDLEPTWEAQLSEEDKSKLEEIVKSVPKPNPKEFNLMGLSAKFMDSGNLNVTILLRNGNSRAIKLQQLPLEIKDAAGEVVARGGFTLEDFEVKANTTKPWSFVFPKEMILKENPDFSSWTASPIQ